MSRIPRAALLLLFLSPWAQAETLPAATAAKFVRIIAQASGAAKVECADKELAGELATQGIGLDATCKVAWAANEHEVARLAKQGKLVITGKVELLAAGASLAIAAEGGRPVIYVNPRNLAGTGIALPDSIVKIAKVAK